jgi:hypothetical protein
VYIFFIHNFFCFPLSFLFSFSKKKETFQTQLLFSSDLLKCSSHALFSGVSENLLGIR